jgi:hypothetical protein
MRQFETEDQPAFQSWLALTFGPQMTELRENAMLIAERMGLIYEVEEEMMCSGHDNPRRAYAAVMKRRERGAQASAEVMEEGPYEDEGFDDEFDAYSDDEIPEYEREAMFEEFLFSQGIDPARMGRQKYAQMFEQFKADVFGDTGGEEVMQARVEAAAVPNAEEARIKEVYRRLVRRLHPDLRADGDATVSAIWHDVQKAYEARNLVRLEALLAVTETEPGAGAGRATLSQMREALAELRRAYSALRQGITEAMRSPAWGFSRDPYHRKLEQRMRRDMTYDLDKQREILAMTERTLDEWSRPGHAAPVHPAGARGSRGKNGKNGKGGMNGMNGRRGPVQADLFGEW